MVLQLRLGSLAGLKNKSVPIAAANPLVTVISALVRLCSSGFCSAKRPETKRVNGSFDHELNPLRLTDFP